MSQLFVDDVVNKEGTGSVGFSKGINVSASSTITGNLNVSGVLTYEDVTNIDAVGVVTARSGIKLGAAGIGGTIAANGDTTLAGVVTATSFSGDVTGDVTGSVTATSSPAITIRDGATEKGYIGFNGNDPFIGRKDGVGLSFQNNKVRPVDGDDGSPSNNTIDIGEPTYKFKDLYLAGNANIAGAGSTFGGNVTLSKAAGPTLELVTNANTANSSLHLSEGTAGSTTNGGAVIYSGANNKLSICCGTDLTTERIGLARDTGEVNIGSGVTISSAGVSTFSGDVNVGSAVTVYASSGIVSATSYYGDASNMSGMAGGAWEVISSVNLGPDYGQNYVDFTGITTSSGYIQYQLVFSNVQLVDNSAEIFAFRFYRGSTDALEDGSEYSHTSKKSYVLNNSITQESATSNAWKLFGTSNNDMYNYSGTMSWPNAFDPANKLSPPMASCFLTSGNTWFGLDHCRFTSTNTEWISGVRFMNYGSGDNLSDGRVSLYGQKY